MKTTIKILGILALAVIAGGSIGCSKGSRDLTEADCSMFFKTTPGEEMIILACSGLPVTEEAYDLLNKFQLKYGEENVKYVNRDPHRPNPEAVPNCYEITMTIDHSSSSVPSMKDLYTFGFLAVRVAGTTTICKMYVWACSEKQARESLLYIENSYRIDKTYNKPWSTGTIVNSTMENLGHEVRNMLVNFK